MKFHIKDPVVRNFVYASIVLSVTVVSLGAVNFLSTQQTTVSTRAQEPTGSLPSMTPMITAPVTPTPFCLGSC